MNSRPNTVPESTKHTPEIDWQKLYRERADRLKRLIDRDAPQVLVYMAAKTLLQTEFHNSTRRMVWSWFVRAVRMQIGFWRSDIGVLRWRLAGWPRSCAIELYFGDIVANHKKIGCRCGVWWEDFEEEMRSRLREMP